MNQNGVEQTFDMEESTYGPVFEMMLHKLRSKETEITPRLCHFLRAGEARLFPKKVRTTQGYVATS